MFKHEIAFGEPIFREAPNELVEIALQIRDKCAPKDENPYTRANEEILKVAGLSGLDSAYGEVKQEIVQDSGYPLVDIRKIPDAIPPAARLHIDYPDAKTPRPTALFSPVGSKATEFAVASCVKFKRSFFRDPFKRITDLSYGDSYLKLQPVLPLNWFEISIGASEGTSADYDTLDRLGITVHEGRIATAPPDHVAVGDARILMHRTPRYIDTESMGAKRILIVARPGCGKVSLL